MNPKKKVFLTVLSFVLAMAVIACSCSSLIPATTPTQSSPVQENPVQVVPQQETMPGLAGTWHSPDTDDVFVIVWQNGEYAVVSATYGTTSYVIDYSSWSGSSLSWSYYDTDLALTVTLETTSLSGDTLNINWSLSDGSNGSTILERQ
jgi:hypothetical protein